MIIIVIVEDHCITAFEIQLLLENEGYKNIISKAYGKEAIAQAQNNNCTHLLFIMDIGLRGPLDGLQTAEEIKKVCSNAHFIIISGEGERLKEARNIYEHTIPKPINDGELIKTVQTIISNL